jgi:hypothetical protein
MVIALCSRESITQPWINFEAGAGWNRGIEIVPTCHSGLPKGELPSPLRSLQAVQASERDGLERLYRQLASKARLSRPPPVTGILKEVKSFEKKYRVKTESKGMSKDIKDTSREIRGIEQPNVPEMQALLTKIIKLIERLKREDKLTELIETGSSFKNPFQDRVAAWRVSRTRAHVDLVRQREWELEAKSSNAYVAYVFENVMDFLGPRDVYCTMTNARFWSKKAVGDSAFLPKNVEAVQRGAVIMRVFLIDDKQWRDRKARGRLIGLLRVHEEACQEANSTNKGKMIVKCLFSDNFNRDYILYRHFGLARHLIGKRGRDDGALVIVPRYTSTVPGSAITHLKLIFSDGPSTATNTIEFVSKFDRAMRESIDLAAVFRKVRRSR